MKRRAFIMIIITFIAQYNVEFINCKNPIIAIYANAEPDNSEFSTLDKVNANYVRWLESSGAEIIIIHTWYNQTTIDKILNKSNGALFQGGARTLNLFNNWEKNAEYILKKIIKMNNEGVYIPLWATCQGFELLHSLIANTTEVLSKFNSYNFATPIKLVESEIGDSNMFSQFSKNELFSLEYKNSTAEFHHLGISLDKYTLMQSLDQFFKITGTGTDNDGKVYIATVESRKYPIYAVQFHPEKTPFDRNLGDSIPQFQQAVIISQRFSQFFVNEARKNNNIMTYEEKLQYDYINTYENSNRYCKGYYIYENVFIK